MPIVAAAFCPHPPLLVPVVAGAAAPELEDLRAACAAAIGAVLTAAPDEMVVVGPADDEQVFAPVATGDLERFGVPRDAFAASLAAGDDGATHRGAPELPPALTIGAWLLRRAGWSGPVRAVAVTGATTALPLDASRRTALLVMGDGSARRSLKAPGYLDERAAPFDATVAAALASGDPRQVLALDAALAGDLLAGGLPAWHAAAAALGGETERWRSELLYDEAPYGVGYLVATWTRG